MIKVNSSRGRKNEGSKEAENFNKASRAKHEQLSEMKESIAEEENVEQELEEVHVDAFEFVEEEVVEEVAEEVVEDEPQVEEVVEETEESVDFDSMTKDELEAYARENFGIELDKRKSLAKLVEIVKDFESNK